MLNKENERELAEGFRRGDPEAFRLVVDEYSDGLHRLLWLYTRREELAEDLTQEVFLRAFAKRDLLVRTDNFRAWLFTMARNIAAKEMKRHRYRLEFSLEDISLDGESPAADFGDDAPSAASLLQSQETRRLLLETLNELDDDQRELIAMRYFADLPLKDIADSLGIPMGTIGGKLQRALKDLRRELERRGMSWPDLGPME